MTEAKIQHYVPKFLLRNFGTGKKDHVWVFDKNSGRTFQTNAKNVASENRFYDFELNGESHSIEHGLSVIESHAKIVIDKILHEDSLSSLNSLEKANLASFLAIQFIRTKSFRLQWAELPKILRKKIDGMGIDVAPDSQAASLIQDPTENQIKLDCTRMILDAPKMFGPHFLDKAWILAKTTNNHPFIISDNPISLQNQIDMGPYGNLGLAVRGIEVYLPLSSTRALAMWCPSLVSQIMKSAETLRRIPKAILEKKFGNSEGILAIDTAVRTGSTLMYEPQHVINFNALQVSRSERYLFSIKNEFSLAEKMISDHPQLRVGPRLEAS